MFKATLGGQGLHPTKDFFFSDELLSQEMQAKALAALDLVYHPLVEPGMDRDAFMRTLIGANLIDAPTGGYQPRPPLVTAPEPRRIKRVK